jgi:hypothetical protein
VLSLGFGDLCVDCVLWLQVAWGWSFHLVMVTYFFTVLWLQVVWGFALGYNDLFFDCLLWLQSRGAMCFASVFASDVCNMIVILLERVGVGPFLKALACLAQVLVFDLWTCRVVIEA